MHKYTIPVSLSGLWIIIIYLALQLDTSPPLIIGDSMQPRSFPIFLMILNLVLTMVLARQMWTMPAEEHASVALPTWLSIVVMILFCVTTIYADMFLALPLAMFALALVWGERNIFMASGVALVTPYLVFMLFSEVLMVRFPRGILIDWYYG